MWMTPAEWAEAALPGLPATRQGIDALIRREGWIERPALARPRKGREGGGGFEYHLDNAPLSARIALAARHFRVEAEDLRPAIGDDDGLSARARECRDARLVLVGLADRFRREQGLSIVAADTLFAGLFNSRSTLREAPPSVLPASFGPPSGGEIAGGDLVFPEWVTRSVQRLSARSLARWRKQRGAPNALGFDPALARKGTGQLDRALDGQVRTFVLAAIAKMPFLSTRRALELVAAEFGETLDLPPLRTFQRQLAIWKAEYANELEYLTDPDGYRSKTEFALVNAARAERLNECWQIDASPADVMLKEGRHSIYLAIDVHSRRIKVLATRTPRAAGVGLIARKCLIAWGVPERIKIDNGSDFSARATQRLFAALGIEVAFSPPYQPKAKGMVERAIGTFQRDLAGLPGFIGHSVADRKRIEGRKAFAGRLGADAAELFGVDMDLAAFQAWCDEWTDTIYASTPHEGLGRRTPFQAAASFAGPMRRVENIAALDILLAPVAGKDGLRTVTKTGIRIDGAHYLTGSVMPGTTVFCRMDPADLGRVLLFEPDGETYLGEAVSPELAGLDPAETIARVKAMQKARLQDGIADIRREMRRIGPRAVADAMRRAGEKRAGTLVAFPQRATGHETAALSAAGDAAGPVEPAPLDGRAAALHAAMTGAGPSSAPTGHLLPASGEKGDGSFAVRRLPETRERRFRRALDLERRIDAGELVGERDLLWLGGYREGSEYRAMRQMFEEFGGEAMRL